MASLMKDPVILPTSRTTIDRATIKSHLLSDTKDPFNRMPLAIEDVIPGMFLVSVLCPDRVLTILLLDTELKAKIETFLIERRQQVKASRVPASESMDVS